MASNHSRIFDKEIEIRKLNEQLEAAKASIPKLEKQKSEIYANLPAFMQDHIDGTWNRRAHWNGSFESLYNQNPWIHSKWQSYQNVQQQISNYQNQIAQLPKTIETERDKLESLRQAKIEKLQAENVKFQEEQRIKEELEHAKAEAKEFQENNRNLTKSLDPNSEEYKNLMDTQASLEQNVQKLTDQRKQIKDTDPLQLLNQNSEQNSNTQASNQEGNSNKSTLDYYNDSAAILAKHPDLAAQYNRNKIDNPRKALETLVQNAYEKDIANGNTDNLIEYRDIIDKIDKENLEIDIKTRKAKAQEEIEKANINPKTGKQFTEEERKAALEAMFNSKEGYPPAEMDNLIFAGKPVWYNNLNKHIAIRAAQELSPEKPYPYYTKPRIAQPSKEETIAYDLLSKNLLKPEYEESFKTTLKNLQDLQEKSPSKNLSTADERAEEKTTNENIENYVNPKTNSVLDLIQKRAMRNFNENIMPKVSAPFIARGSFNTGARAEAQARARRDLMEGLMDSETQYLASAYDKARDTASADKRTYLNYKLAKAELESDEILKKGKVAEDTSKLMDTYHKNKLLDMEALRTVGQSRRDVEQRKLDLEHQEFENEKNYPIRQLDILSKMTHQLPVESIIGKSSSTANAPTRNEQVSPWAQGANIAGSILAANMMNKAEGGMIQRHARGGMIDKMKDQYLQDLMTRAQNTGGNTQNPWAHYLMGLSSKLGTSSDVMQDLVKGSSQGLSQFMHAKEYNKGLEDQNLAFKKSIIDYLDQADERKMANRLNEAKINYYNNRGNNKASGIQKSAVPPTVQRFNAGVLNEKAKEAKMANTENMLIKQSEEALKKIEENTNSFTGPGSLAAKAVDKFNFLENLYPEEAQRGFQGMRKAASLLEQNRKGKTDIERATIREGLPKSTILPDTNRDVFATKGIENINRELNNAFYTEWFKQTGGRLEGAEMAYNDFIRNKPLLVENQPNYALMKEIPEAVYEYISEEPAISSNNTEHDSLDDISDERIENELRDRNE